MRRTYRDIRGILTSRQRLKQFLATPLYANALYLIANTLIMALFGFFFWTVVARVYTEAEVGYSSATISIMAFLSSLSLLGLPMSLIRFLPQAEKPGRLINSCFTLGGLVSLVVAGIFVIGLGTWSPALAFIKGNAIFALVFIVFVLLLTLSTLIDAVFVARRRARFVLVKNAISSLLKIPLPLLLVLYFHSFGIIASWVIALGIAIAVSLWLFLPRVQRFYRPMPTLNLTPIKDMWTYSGGSYLGNLFSLAPILILPIMVVNRLGPQSNAYFYIVWMIATLLTAIPLSVSQSLFAEGSHFEDKLRENILKSFRFTFLLLIPAVLLMVLAGKWLLLAFGPSYAENGLNLLQILSIASLPLGMNHIYVTILRVAGRIKELVMIRGVVALAVLVISYLIMPETGIIGVGYAWLGAQSLAAIYVIVRLRFLWRP